MKIKSPTFDESVHLTAGYLALVDKDFSFSPEHPPLIRSFAALPLLIFDQKIPDKTEFIKQNKFQSKLGMFDFAGNFVFRSQNDADQNIFLGRLSIVFLSMVLGFYVFLWAKKLYGNKSGLFALVLYVFSPNILAHSRLVTTDLGVTCFMFIACYYFWCYLKEEKIWQYGLAALFTSFSIMSKFSALTLFPIFILMTGVILYERRKCDKDHPFLTFNKGILKQLKEILIHAFIFIIVFTGVIFVAYGVGSDALILFKQGLTVLWKDYFWKQYISDQPTHTYAYLLGYYYASSKWFYPIVVFLVKTPVPIFILLVLSLGLIQLNRKDLFNEYCLMISIVIFFSVSILDSGHYGLRRFLPMYPFLYVYLSNILKYVEVPTFGSLKRKMVHSTLTLLVGWYVFSSINIYPDYLTYFNDWVGGPRNGINILDDSNIDWGQDLKRLKPFMDKHGIKKVKLLFYGTADPDYYQIRTELLSEKDRKFGPKNGYFAISASKLAWMKNLPTLFGFGPAWKELKNTEPLGVIGNTIYIFKFGDS